MIIEVGVLELEFVGVQKSPQTLQFNLFT